MPQKIRPSGEKAAVKYKTGLLVSNSPHLVTKAGYQKDHAVCADRPGPRGRTVAATIFFGPGALARILFGAVFAFLGFCYDKIMKKPDSTGDLSCLVTGHSCHERPCRLPDLDMHRLLRCHHYCEVPVWRHPQKYREPCHRRPYRSAALLDVLHDHMAGDELPEGHHRCPQPVQPLWDCFRRLSLEPPRYLLARCLWATSAALWVKPAPLPS